MTPTPLMYLIVCPLCLLAGFIDSIAGGGGLISLPAYYLAGLPVHLSAGTNKFSATWGTALSLWKYGKSKKILWQCGIPAALAAFPGSYLGTLLLTALSDRFIYWMMIILLPCVALLVLFGPKGKRKPLFSGKLPEFFVCLFIGLLIGFYDGLVGPGTGSFLILLFTALLGMEAVKASGTAKVVNLASNVASLVTLAFSGNVLYLLAIPAALCSIAGNYFGTRLAIHLGEKVIRTVLLIVLALLLLTMVFRLL